MTTKIDITKAEVISIGDELLLGKTVDTNSSWISLELMKLGIKVSNKSIISDKESEIINSLNLAKRSELIIVTGGLGPTHDDITVSSFKSAFNLPQQIDEEYLQQLESMFSNRGVRMPKINENQAIAKVTRNIYKAISLIIMMLPKLSEASMLEPFKIIVTFTE